MKYEKWRLAGASLRIARREKKLTLKQLAGRIGCCFSYISDIEKGQKRPSYGTAELFAQQLNVELDEICAGFEIVPPDVAELVTRDAETLKEVRQILGGA